MAESINQPPEVSPSPSPLADGAVAAADLPDSALLRELATLHRTRHDTFLHGSEHALRRHSERTAEIEAEYLRRHPERQVDADRLRSGARARP
jgi:hypothetical protein